MPADRNAARRRVDVAADQLYGLAPDEFIAARGELAKQARADGDADAARDIGRLGKPTLPAWFANQLVRQQPDEIAELIELGETLRSATAKLDAGQIRELSGDRRRLIGELLGTARRLGDDAGRPMTDAVDRAVEDTLHAALADPDAAEQLRAGRLAAPLESSGFPGLDPAAAAPTRKTAAKKTAERTAKKSAATAAKSAPELSAAKAALREAESSRSEARRHVTAAERQVQRAADTVERLENELAEARQARADADKAHRKAVRALADADRAVRTATAALDKTR